MRNRILLGTLSYLVEKYGQFPAVREVSLSRYFTTVTLADRSVGCCMSYYSGQDHDLEASGRAIAKYIHDDPLKVTELAEHAAQLLTSGLIQQSNNVVSSVLASVVSAASERLLQCPVSETYILSRTLPEAWFKDAHAALIVGFGGFLGTVCRFSHVRWVHVIDLKYENRRHEIDSYMASFKNQYPDRRFTVSTHIDIHRYMQDFDLVCVTGSTLCNDTLEPFLENKASGSRLLLQGQSASVYPALLFLHGVDGIATTLKPQILSDLARGCYSGDRLRPYLEGKLPWMYLSHRSGKSRNAGAFWESVRISEDSIASMASREHV